MSWDVIVVMILVVVIVVPIYLLPSFVAYKRKHKNAIAIILINFFLGTTVVGWVGALVWAVIDGKPKKEVVSNDTVMSGVDEIIKYKDLLDQGIITKEEFEVKKKQLLDL